MKTTFALLLLAAATFPLAAPSHAQPPRTDVIWARASTPGAITLDGVLNEAAWAPGRVQDRPLRRRQRHPGQRLEGRGRAPAEGPDQRHAQVPASSATSSTWAPACRTARSAARSDFNRFDGLLMSTQGPRRDVAPRRRRPSTSTPGGTPTRGPRSAAGPGKQPTFIGRWATLAARLARARRSRSPTGTRCTVVHGHRPTPTRRSTPATRSRCASTSAPMGYDVTEPDGDIVEWNISIYDCDWFWPLDVGAASAPNRVWWQSPWGNAVWYNEVQDPRAPDVTITSGPVPAIGPELRVRNAAASPAPTIDGMLTEPVWAAAPSFDIRYGDDALRDTYPGVGPWRAGQYQPHGERRAGARRRSGRRHGEVVLQGRHRSTWASTCATRSVQYASALRPLGRLHRHASTTARRATRDNNARRPRGWRSRSGPTGTAIAAGLPAVPA